MKKLLIASALLCLNTSSQAQAPAPPKPPSIEERMKHTNEMLQKELQLSAHQKAAIEASFKTFFTAEDQLRKDNPPAPPPPPDPKIKAAMDKLAKQRDESIKKILTEEQYQKYLETEKKMRPPMPGKNGKGGPPAPKQ